MSCCNKIPQHLAVIMDGNRRWARQRALPLLAGHRAGVEKLLLLAELCVQAQIPYCSVYAFSTENWQRPESEVKSLLALIHYVLERYAAKLLNAGIRIRFAGSKQNLSSKIVADMAEIEAKSALGKQLNLIICLNYGGRAELVHAFRSWQQQAAPGTVPSEEELERFLYLPDVPPVDLFFRLGGEQRLSNFWLWQSAYAELYFSDCLWPDFSEAEFTNALAAFAQRNRRFGANIKEEEK